MFAAVITLGAVAGFAQVPAQDPCADAAGQTTLGDKFRELYPKKDIESRKAAIDTGKQFLEKYGSCDSAKDLSDYLKTTIPKMEKIVADLSSKAEEDKLVARFNAALTAKNWDEVYASGKEILAKYPDKFRVVELVFGSIGLDETAKSPRVTKWNEDTLKYAKISIQDLESGKLTTFGIKPFVYTSKEDALAWMNYTIGYLLTYDKKNYKDGAAYLFKAAGAAASQPHANPELYQGIGVYYYDLAKVQIPEVQTMVKDQKADDTPEVKQQKIVAIKAKIGILNGTVERAIDAYSRAYDIAPKTPAGKPYRDGLYKTLGELYSVRFEKGTGLEAFIKTPLTKPLPDPASTISPILDPEPAPTATTPATPATVKPTTPTKPVTPPAKPGIGKQSVGTDPAAKAKSTTATTAKPAVKPVVKKKGTR